MSKQDRHGARTPSDVARLLGGKVGKKDNGQVVTMLNSAADVLVLKGNRLVVVSDNFKLTEDGTIIATAGKIGGCTIKDGVLLIKNANIAEKLTADKIDAKDLEVDAANITGNLTAEQIDATDLEFKQGTVGSWHLGKTDIHLNASEFLRDVYALYSDEIYETRVDGDGHERAYTYQVFLTAEGVYAMGRYDTSAESAVPYYSNKTWLDICES